MSSKEIATFWITAVRSYAVFPCITVTSPTNPICCEHVSIRALEKCEVEEGEGEGCVREEEIISLLQLVLMLLLTLLMLLALTFMLLLLLLLLLFSSILLLLLLAVLWLNSRSWIP